MARQTFRGLFATFADCRQMFAKTRLGVVNPIQIIFLIFYIFKTPVQLRMSKITYISIGVLGWLLVVVLSSPLGMGH